MTFFNPSRIWLTAAAAALALFFSASSWAGVDTNTSSGGTAKGPGLAVHGYDAVAYFSEGRALKGSAQHATVYNDATYQFASKEHLQAFKKHPEKYAPQYGGYCAYGVAVGAKFDGDPDYWKIVDGKLYLNLNNEIQQTWLKDIGGNIEKADGNWKKIANKAPSEL